MKKVLFLRDLFANLQNLPVERLRQLVEFTKPTPPPAPKIQPPSPQTHQKLFPPKKEKIYIFPPVKFPFVQNLVQKYEQKIPDGEPPQPPK